jgi:hypothetical protein
MCNEVRNAGTGYTPVLTAFAMSLTGSTLTIKADGLFIITGLGSSNVTFSITQDMTCIVDPVTHGLMLVANGAPVTDHDTHITGGYWALGAIFLPVAGFVVAAVVAGVIDAIIAIVTAAVTSQVTTAGSTAGIGVAPMVALNWLGSGALTLQVAELNDGLIMRGSLA